MYPVSDVFLQAVQMKTRHYYWTGKITTTGGAVYEFGPEDIVKGSGYISAQCCGSSEIEMGTVYAAEFGISLFSSIDRYTLKDAKIELFYHLELTDGTYETVPMGIFEVSEANRKVRTLELKGYDYMLRFERNFNGFETIGVPYDFIALCCKACKVEMAQTKEQIEAMTNGTQTLSIYTENDIETYRDCLYYVGQVLAGFFVINREGKLELRKYGMSPVQTYEAKHRFSSSFSDFITRYTAVNSTNRRTEIAEYYALETDDALTMNLGVNPLLQFGLEETREMLCRNILNDIAQIRYVPFESDTIGNPALDLGDVLTFSGGQADASQLAAITSMEIKIGGKETLKCVGKNPLLAQSKSKNDKNIAGLMNSIEQGKIGIHTFTNASVIDVAETDKKIISIQFATSEANHVQFFGQVMINVAAKAVTKAGEAAGSITVPALPVSTASGISDADGTDNGSSDSAGMGAGDTSESTDSTESGTGDTSGNTDAGGTDTTAESSSTSETVIQVALPVTIEMDGQAEGIITYEFNDTKLTTPVPVETWHSGKHILSLYYPIENVIANYTNTFNVYLRMTGGTGRIEVGDIIASISGQSMAAKEAWDGKITIDEKIQPFRLSAAIRPIAFTEVMAKEVKWVVNYYWSDTITGRQKVGAFGQIIETGGTA